MCVQGKYSVSRQGCLTFSGQNDRTCVLAGVFPEEVPLSMVLRSLPIKNTNLLTSVCFLPPILHAVRRGSKCMHSLSLLPPTLQMTGPTTWKCRFACSACKWWLDFTVSYLTPATVNVVGGTSKITAVPTPSSAQLYIEINLWALLGSLRFYLNADKMRGGERSFTCSDSTIHKSLDNILSLPIIRSCSRSERVDWKRVKAGLKQYSGTGHQSQSHRSSASHVHRIPRGQCCRQLFWIWHRRSVADGTVRGGDRRKTLFQTRVVQHAHNVELCASWMRQLWFCCLSCAAMLTDSSARGIGADKDQTRQSQTKVKPSPFGWSMLLWKLY